MSNQIKKIVHVKITSTSEGIRKTVIEGVIPAIGKAFNEYQEAKGSYERDGYEIVSEDIDKLSFVAEKTYDD